MSGSVSEVSRLVKQGRIPVGANGGVLFLAVKGGDCCACQEKAAVILWARKHLTDKLETSETIGLCATQDFLVSS